MYQPAHVRAALFTESSQGYYTLPVLNVAIEVIVSTRRVCVCVCALQMFNCETKPSYENKLS